LPNFQLTLKTRLISSNSYRNYVTPLTALENYVFLLFGSDLDFIRPIPGQ